MSETSTKLVAKRALREAAEAVRWNKPVPVMLALVSAAVTFAITLWSTGNFAWSAVAGVATPLSFLLILFMGKMYSVPLAMASEATAREEAALTELSGLRAESRDPDGIYQHGTKVGTIRLPVLEPSRSAAQFAQIFEAVDFDASQPFEYRGWVLKLDGFDSDFTGYHGGIPFRALQNVRAELISRR